MLMGYTTQEEESLQSHQGVDNSQRAPFYGGLRSSFLYSQIFLIAFLILPYSLFLSNKAITEIKNFFDWIVILRVEMEVAAKK